MINRAVLERPRTRKRAAAARRMDALRAAAPRVTTDEVAAWLRENRERSE